MLNHSLAGMDDLAYGAPKRTVKMENGQTPGHRFGAGVASACELLLKQGIVVTAVKVKFPGIDPLMIVSAKTTEGAQISFIKGQDLDACGILFHKRVLADVMEWREDKFEMERLAKMLDI